MIFLKPKVSILWVNYNSSSFIDLVLESLQAVKDIDYPNYELIIVDNATTDGSLKIISDFIKQHRINSKIIQLQKNVGYTGGNNVAYQARDPESKYVVLLNNDAVPEKYSLKKLVKIMEDDESLGAVQGIILSYDEKTIDTAGDFLSELFNEPSYMEGEPLKFLTKPIYATSPDGAYSVCRVTAIKKIRGCDDKMFDDFLFACYDDHLLGLRLWNHGFKVKVVPLITAKHKRGSSFRKVTPLQFYLGIRNRIIINEMSNSRYKTLLRLLFVKDLLLYFLHRMFRIFGLKAQPNFKEVAAIFLRALIDGIRISRIKRRNKDTVDIYKAPIIRIKPLIAFLGVITRTQVINAYLKKQLKSITAYVQ